MPMSPFYHEPSTAPTGRVGLGVVIHSYPIRAADKASHFNDPLTFLEHCHGLGAAGVQTNLGVRDEAAAAKLRERAAALGMYLEASVRLPRDAGEVDRFTAEVRTARACGATVARTVLMGGRRYEVFKSAEQFWQFAAQAAAMLRLARPVVERFGVRLAIENHKDLEAPSLAELIRSINSPQIGVCLDTGNNLALLEDALATVETLAPFAFTTHVKDMGVEEYPDGFLLAEVPLGAGFLDLPQILNLVRKARPGVRFNLEMITRDPLRIPCLMPGYWATLEQVPGRRLAAALAQVRHSAGKTPLPRVSGLGHEEQLRREEENVRASFRYARGKLGL